MRKILFTLHLYLALISGLFIVVLGLTGAVMAFEPELEHVFHASLSYVKPQPHALTLAEIGTAVSAKYPRERIQAYLLSTSPNLSYQVALRGRLVAVNQYTGEVLGERRQGPDFLSYVHQLHLRLLLHDKGDSGKKIMSWVAVVMLLVLLSGIYLWWPQKRVSVKWSGVSGMRTWFDLHNVVGALSFVFLLVLTITGLMIGFEETTVPLFYKLTGSEPSRPPKVLVTPPPNVQRITPDQALAIARNALPGASPFAISIPPPKGVYLIAARYPEDLTPGGRSRIALDPYNGKVLYAEGSRTAPAGTRMVIANRAIHTGDIFGVPSKIVMSVASLMAALQVLTGAGMWWKRGRSEDARVSNVSKASNARV